MRRHCTDGSDFHRKHHSQRSLSKFNPHSERITSEQSPGSWHEAARGKRNVRFSPPLAWNVPKESSAPWQSHIHSGGCKAVLPAHSTEWCYAVQPSGQHRRKTNWEISLSSFFSWVTTAGSKFNTTPQHCSLMNDIIVLPVPYCRQNQTPACPQAILLPEGRQTDHICDPDFAPLFLIMPAQGSSLPMHSKNPSTVPLAGKNESVGQPHWLTCKPQCQQGHERFNQRTKNCDCVVVVRASIHIWIFYISNFLPFHFLRKGLDKILINPERHISSTANSSRTRSIVLSNSERLPYNLWSIT